MKNFAALAVFALAGYAAAAPPPELAPRDGTLICGPGAPGMKVNDPRSLAKCQALPYVCECNFQKVVVCGTETTAPPDFFCNLGCECR